MERFNKELTEVTLRFNRFNQAFLSYVVRKHGPKVWKEAASDVELRDLPSYGTVRFPWFADTSRGLR